MGVTGYWVILGSRGLMVNWAGVGSAGPRDSRVHEVGREESRGGGLGPGERAAESCFGVIAGAAQTSCK